MNTRNISTDDVRVCCSNILEAVKAFREGLFQHGLWFCNMPTNKIEQIKIMRAALGLGLKEAKDMVERVNPTTKGGTVGPVPFEGTLESAQQKMNEYIRAGYLRGYKANWIKSR